MVARGVGIAPPSAPASLLLLSSARLPSPDSPGSTTPAYISTSSPESATRLLAALTSASHHST
eukprot:2453244-Rhodomonas_salina.1